MSGLNRNAAIYFSGRGVPPVRWAAAAKPAKQVGGRNTVAETGGTPVPLCALPQAVDCSIALVQPRASARPELAQVVTRENWLVQRSIRKNKFQLEEPIFQSS